MKRIGGLLLFLLLSLSLQAQEKDCAVIVSQTETFRLTSPVSGEHTVDKTILVNHEDGLDAATLVIYQDSFRSLASFSGEVTSLQGSGKPLKLKEKDLVVLALSSGLADDGKTASYTPQGRYPMLVHYVYKIHYRKGIASFPAFTPIESEKVKLAEASFTVDVPEGFPIKDYSHMVSREVSTEKGRTLYRWTVKDFPAVVEEDMMPSYLELLPYVLASPMSIDYGGYQGDQSNWKGVGSWLYSMQENVQELPPHFVSELRKITEGCKSDLEKLEVLYAYLRENTRYVSIQLGIGGLRPMPAEEVHKMGFGDCKGLSNYLRCMLAAVDVPSDYYIIGTDRPNLVPGYASINQMNHAMLAVPMPQLQDTVWVECTNPSYPLGYRHSGAAGHEVVLVQPDGGKVVRIPSYPDSLSRIIQVADVTLAGDGSARLSLSRELWLDEMEPYLGFQNLSDNAKARALTSGMKLHADAIKVESIRNNFNDYRTLGRSFVPVIGIDYSMSTRVYANVNRERIFVPVNPVAMSIPVQKSGRVNPLVNEGGGIIENRVILHIPDGYTIESMPKDVNLDTQWGRFQSHISVEGNNITIVQIIHAYRFEAPAQSYEDYKTFARAVNKAYSSSLVLRKCLSLQDNEG